MASKLIPHSFQSPNWYVDHLAHLLTPQEQAVLNKAVREILGWRNKIESRQARIALSVFTEGKFNRDTGERLAYGCGLKTGAVRTALKALDKYRILVKVGEPTQDGQLFQLQDDDRQIDLLGLSQRFSEKETANALKTQRAREKRKGVMSDNTPNVGQQGGGDVEQHEGVMSDNNKETQEKPKGNPPIDAPSAQPPTCFPDLFSLPVSQIKERKFTRSEWETILEAERSRPDKPPRATLIKWLENKLTGSGHPAIRAYHDEMERYPRKNQFQVIIDTVGENGGAELFGQIVHAWKMAGWNPLNIGGMLDCFTRKEIPNNGKHGIKNGTTQGGSGRGAKAGKNGGTRQPVISEPTQAEIDRDVALYREHHARLERERSLATAG